MSEPTALTGPDLEQGIAESELKEGASLVGHARGEPVLLVRAEGEVFAVAASCSHYGGPLGEGAIVGTTVTCPWHHACFDLRSGAVERAPALNAIACYQIQRSGARIRVGEKLPAPSASRASGAPSRIVIVGAGAAGHYAAETLRRRGYDGALDLIGRDADAPYDRPNLSKDFLAGTASEDWIPLRPDSFYAENAINLVTGATVDRLDLAGRNVVLADGRSLPFERLLLATGADPVALPVPGAELPHVHLLRTLTDCRRLIAACGSARKVALIGSGFIGLEAAAALRARGLDVAVVSPDVTPLGRVVGDQVGGFLRRLHEEHGVVFHLGESISAIEPDAVITGNGKRIAADLVLVAIGVRPAAGLASAAGLKIDRGVLVDGYLETSAPGVFAAGDVARFPDARSGKLIRVEHWAVAQNMGATAAENMLGGRHKFTTVPFFWSVHYDVTLSYVGHAESPAQASLDGRLEDRDCRVSYSEDGAVRAVLTIGRDRESLGAERELLFAATT
jgi:NADPH-dependent 2,4-dienoyl-CoA reductase/sulfur reductase-like enzyme/nitrite reductase/ring-hydroxylating ferredoxin subunit